MTSSPASETDPRQAPAADAADFPVRPATEADAEEFLRLRRLIFDAWPIEVDTEKEPGWPERYVQAFRELLAEPNWMALAIDDPAVPGRLAGCVSVAIERHLPGPGSRGLAAYLADMCTDPSYRGRGLGRKLLTAAREWGAEQGAGWMHLYATESGIPVYERDGFEGRSGPFLHMGRSLP